MLGEVTAVKYRALFIPGFRHTKSVSSFIEILGFISGILYPFLYHGCHWQSCEVYAPFLRIIFENLIKYMRLQRNYIELQSSKY